MKFELDVYRELLNIPDGEIRRKLEVNSTEERPGVRYEGIQDVTDLYNPGVLPAHVYVRDGRAQMVYIPSGAAIEGLTTDELEAELGGEGTRLRSRAGKKFNHYVHPDKGVAYSSDTRHVRFIEVFPPCSLESYKEDIYREPPTFKR